MKPKRLIDLYVYRKTGDTPELLLLKRSEKKIYSGQWRMIGGKTEQNEKQWQTALRELKEETGLTPDLFWCVPTINHFYEIRTDQIHLIPAFAAEVAGDSLISLDDEHSEYRWLEFQEAEKLIAWPEQKRIIACIKQLVINSQILQDWIISDYYF